MGALTTRYKLKKSQILGIVANVIYTLILIWHDSQTLLLFFFCFTGRIEISTFHTTHSISTKESWEILPINSGRPRRPLRYVWDFTAKRPTTREHKQKRAAFAHWTMSTSAGGIVYPFLFYRRSKCLIFYRPYSNFYPSNPRFIHARKIILLRN